MNCLLVAATAKEIYAFLEQYRSDTGKTFAGDHIDVLITGIGLTATTYSLTRHFYLKRPELVIQAGIAGCFDTTIPLGTVLAVKQDAIADESVVEAKQLKTLFDMGLVQPGQFPYQKGWLVNPAAALLKKTRLKTVKAISVNQISTSRPMIRQYEQVFQPVIETMEGAALHYVCLCENVPFLQLRSVSNYIGERNKTKWQMKEAIGNLNKELIRLLQSL